MPEISLLLGTWASQRAKMVEEALMKSSGTGLLVVPSQTQARVRRECLALQGNGTWGKSVITFTDFAEWLLQDFGVSFRRIGDYERYLILDQCLQYLDNTGELPMLAVPVDTPGLIHHLLRVITQLKQAAIEPEEFHHRIVEGNLVDDFDTLVAKSYMAYQTRLQQMQAYDIPGLYWEAALQSSVTPPDFLKQYTLLCFDGFDDFTPSEFRLLENLIPACAEVIFGINHDSSPTRSDLFMIPRLTTERIQQLFSVNTTVCEEPEPQSHAAFAARSLFWRDPPVYSERLDRNLCIKPCIDLEHEVESLARQIKLAVLSGTPAHQIALVFPDMENVAGAVQSTFKEYQVPLRLQYRPRLNESAIGAFLLRLCEAIQTWERDTVLDVVSSPWFPKAPGAEEYGPLFPTLARAAQIIRGRQEWRERFQLLLKRIRSGKGQDIIALKHKIPEAEAVLNAFAQTLATLGNFSDTMPDKGTIAGYATHLDSIIDQLHIEAVLDQHPDAELVAAEQYALGTLRDLTAMMSNIENTEKLLSPTAFFQQLALGMTETRYSVPQPASGVWCGDASGIRGLLFDELYYGGLNEGAIPQAAPGSAIYSEQDLERLRTRGIALEGAREQLARQRLLFHHVLVAANHRLTLSWRTMKDGGREATYSPFLAHVRELFPEDTHIQDAPPLSDTFLPQLEDAASYREILNAVIYRWPTEKSSLRTWFPDAMHGIMVEAQRQSSETYDRYDGVLNDEALIAYLQSHYGPDHHFSVNQLETQAQCPFRFFLERVLQIDETEIPEAAFDPRIRGTILHEILCRFHKQFTGIPVANLPDDETQPVMIKLVDDVFDQFARRSITAPPGVRQVERLQMIERLLRYLAIDREREDGPWAPSHFEVTFGRAHHDDVPRDPLSRVEPLALQTEAGTVLFAGIIDRIDKLDNAIRIIDYKSGATPLVKYITQGLSMQLTLYAWGVEQHLIPDSECTEAVYLPIGKEAYREALGKGNNRGDWANREENTLQTIGRAVNDIRRGYFPPTPADDTRCRGCAAAGVCRFEEQRIERKESTVS